MIAVGSDHAGYTLKVELIKYLEENGFEYTDCGCGGEPADYPDIAEKTCALVTSGEAAYAVLVCGTGIGISIAANKIKGIRAALCGDYFSAQYARKHNDANAICFGGRTIGAGLARLLLDVFLHTGCEGGRHAARVQKIMKLEEKSYE